MKIVSFGTQDSYEKYVYLLRDNLSQLGAKHEVDLIPSFGSKKKACLYRPQFLIGKLKETILHTDVDTKFLSLIDLPKEAWLLFDNSWGEWDVGIARNSPFGSFSRLPFVVFVLAIRPTYGSWAFLDTWRRLCEERWDKYDDHQRFVWALQASNSKVGDLTGTFSGKVMKNGFAGKNIVFKEK